MKLVAVHKRFWGGLFSAFVPGIGVVINLTPSPLFNIHTNERPCIFILQF